MAAHETQAVLAYLSEWFKEVEDITLDPNNSGQRNLEDAKRQSMSFRVTHPDGSAVLVVSDVFLDDWSPQEIRQKLELADTAEVLRRTIDAEVFVQGDGQLRRL